MYECLVEWDQASTECIEVHHADTCMAVQNTIAMQLLVSWTQVHSLNAFVAGLRLCDCHDSPHTTYSHVQYILPKQCIAVKSACCSLPLPCTGFAMLSKQSPSAFLHLQEINLHC